MKYFQTFPLDVRLKECIDYNQWVRCIIRIFNQIFDDVTNQANQSGTFVTALNVLKSADTHFSESFRTHMSHGFKLKKRIKEMEIKLEEYNRSNNSAFETVEGCHKLKIKLDNFLNAVPRPFLGLTLTQAGDLAKQQALNEYKSQVNYYQDLVERLYDILQSSFRDSNWELAHKKLIALHTAESELYMHLEIPLHRVDALVLQYYQEILQGLKEAIQAQDLVIFSRRFESFYFYRKLLAKNHLSVNKALTDETTVMHKDLADIIDNCRIEFETMCSEFKFDNALNLMTRLKAIRQFIDSSNIRDYCSSFQAISYLTGLEQSTKRYVRIYSNYSDSGIETLNQAMSKFPQLTKVENNVRDLHRVIIEKVQESVENHEYFKLKSITEALRSFHLLTDIGGGKVLIDSTIKTVQDMIRGSLDGLRQDVTNYWEKSDWSKLNDSIQVLQEAENELKHMNGVIDLNLLYNMKMELEKRLSGIGDQALNLAKKQRGEEGILEFVLKFFELGLVYEQVQAFHIIAKTQITRVLNECRDQRGLHFIFKLGIALEEGDCFKDQSDPELCVRIGRRLVMDFSHFKDVATMTWNKTVSQIPVDESLRNLKSYTYNSNTKNKRDYPLEEAKLKIMYEQYNTKYQQLIIKYLPKDKDKNEIVNEVLALASTMQPCSLNNWDISKKDKIPDLLAGIFAYYTVSKCGDSFNSLGEGEGPNQESISAKEILITPHNIQILTILTLLGCADSPTKLKNHLMQIGTGEGKSIILGALATIFGILNFPVRCVCYSEYLSTRDYNDFKDIFIAFKCDSKITYSKITSFSEHSVTQQGNIRQ